MWWYPVKSVICQLIIGHLHGIWRLITIYLQTGNLFLSRFHVFFFNFFFSVCVLKSFFLILFFASISMGCICFNYTSKCTGKISFVRLTSSLFCCFWWLFGRKIILVRCWQFIFHGKTKRRGLKRTWKLHKDFVGKFYQTILLYSCWHLTVL